MWELWYLHIVQSEISQDRSKIVNLYKKSYQQILRYLLTDAIKRWGKFSLHRYFRIESSNPKSELLNPKSKSLNPKIESLNPNIVPLNFETESWHRTSINLS